MKNRIRRIVNSIRILEHATCTAGGGVIALEDDIPKALKALGVDKHLFDSELLTLNELSELISDAAADLHLKMTELAESEDVKIPTERVVNTGGGSDKP